MLCAALYLYYNVWYYTLIIFKKVTQIQFMSLFGTIYGELGISNNLLERVICIRQIVLILNQSTWFGNLLMLLLYVNVIVSLGMPKHKII